MLFFTVLFLQCYFYSVIFYSVIFYSVIFTVLFFTVLFFTVLLIGPLGGSEATRLQEDVEATHVLVVAIATSQEIGKCLPYFSSFLVKYYDC